MKIPFSPPYIDANVINEVVDSLKSGWITTGPKVKALEEEIGKISGVKNVLCINSWTSGTILMLRWLGLQPGDEVIVPAYTYTVQVPALTAVIFPSEDTFATFVLEDFQEIVSACFTIFLEESTFVTFAVIFLLLPAFRDTCSAETVTFFALVYFPPFVVTWARYVSFTYSFFPFTSL